MNLEALKEYTRWLVKWLAIWITILAAVGQTPLGRDDTDQPWWFGKRSGMTPRTDRLTGCQYLQTSGGGITKRLDAEGRHVGCN